MAKGVKKINDARLFNKLMRYGKKYIWHYILIFVIMLLSIGASLLIDYLIGDVIDRLNGETALDMQTFKTILLFFLGLIIVTSALEYFSAIMLQKIGQGIIYNVRGDVFNAVEHYSTSMLKEIPAGKLATRVTTDVNTLSEMYTSVVTNLLKNVLTIVGVLVFMLIMNWRLALYTMVCIPIVFVLSLLFRNFSRKIYRQVRSGVSEINSFVNENVSGMKITQSFNQEERQMKQFEEKNAFLKKVHLKLIYGFALYRPSIYVITMLTTCLIIWIGGLDVISFTGGFTVGALFTFIQLANKIFGPLQELAEQYNILQSAFASSERIFEAMSKKSEIEEVSHPVVLDDIKGEIEFRNVWFKYPTSDWILQDVSFHIKPKETVAFVGATGSGKTTILALITRNYDIQKGEILIDGIDIRQIELDSLRRSIGQMMQDVFLFSGTVKSNISLRDDAIGDEKIKEASVYVNADQFIKKLPNKYDEEVREHGNNFSSGQRQLLSFARTIAHDPKILILDEATANIDTETELLIQNSLEKMMSVGTMLIVAHRLSTIQHADKIMVISKGKLIEQGNHQELLKQKGHYYKLYQLQYEVRGEENG